MGEKIDGMKNVDFSSEHRFVGSVQGAKGLKGELKIGLFTAHPAHLASLESIYLKIDDSPSTLYTIERATWKGSKLTIKLHGVDDRNTAEALRGANLLVPEEAAYHPGEDEYFAEDLVGMEVVDTKGTILGNIKEVLNYPAHDVYVISGGKNEFLVPAVHEYIREVDVSAGRIMIAVIDGLID